MAIHLRSSIFVLTTILVIVSCDVQKRDVKTTVWPDCDKFNESLCAQAKQNGSIVVYVNATTSLNDNLHYVFSTIGAPTVLLIQTIGVDSYLQFDWKKLLQLNESINGAISFSNDKTKIHYMFGVTFTRLIEYDDIDDSADLNYCEKHLNATSWKIRDFSQFHWNSDEINVDFTTNTFVFNTSSTVMIDTNQTRNGSISFAFSVKQDNGRASDLPRMLYSTNETMFDFVIANYTPSFNNSRFALEAAVISSSTSNMAVDLTKSIDDEYTPGVFEVIDWLANPQETKTSGFLQWKPVAYVKLPRGRSTATLVTHYDLNIVDAASHTAELLNNSVVSAVFNQNLWNDQVFKRYVANISFGLPKDGFYLQNNYTAWTAAIGYGTPPQDSISITVIIIISAGLGLPVVIIIFGGLFSFIRKLRRKPSGYEPINSGSINRTNSHVN